MSSMIIIVWSDYDMTVVERFKTIAGAEKRVTDLLKKEPQPKWVHGVFRVEKELTPQAVQGEIKHKLVVKEAKIEFEDED